MKTLHRFAILSVTAAILAGCGQAGTILAAKSNDGAASNGQAKDRKGPHGPGGREGGMMGLLAGLDLTADQQAALKALREKNKLAAPPSHDPKNNPFKALQDAVLAEKVDDVALRAAIAALEADRANHPRPDMGAQLKAVYEILTPEQRAKIVAKLQAAPQPKARPSGEPHAKRSGDPKGDRLAKLNLTAEQKAAFDALQAKLKGDREAHKPGDRRAAMLAFWQTGDASGLQPPAPPAFPVEEFVKAVELLDQTQRKALFAHGLPGFGGHAGPGGPGGWGGHHGHGPQGAPSASPST